MPLNESGGASPDPLDVVLPTILAQDLAHAERVRIVTPAVANTQPTNLPRIAANLHVQFIIHGSVTRTDRGFSLNLRLFDAEQNGDLFSKKFDSDFLSFNSLRQRIEETILGELRMEPVPLSFPAKPSNALAYERYLTGLYYLNFSPLSDLPQAGSAFEQSIALDSTFGPAYSGMAQVRLTQYIFGPKPNDISLSSAYDLVQTALKLSPNDPSAYRDLAEYYFLSRRFGNVDQNIQKSLALQPEDPRSYAILSQLEIVGGNYDLALQYALRAAKVMPDNAYVQLAVGLAQQFKGSYSDAVNAFQKSISLGLPDSLITARYLVNAWSAQENYSDLIQYYQKSLQSFPQDYREYYWIARAYQMRPSINDFKEWSEKGKSILSDHLDKDPADANARAYLALFLSREGKADDGETEMNRAIGLEPNSTEILFRQANMYAIQKKIPSAIASLRAALDKDYRFSEILNPDFSLLRSDTSFTSTIARDIGTK